MTVVPSMHITVLPKFEVTLEGPKQLTEEEDFITGKVAAK